MIIENKEFCKIFDEQIFKKTKFSLLEKMAKYPFRYVGIFRPTMVKDKILQNITQSHEIKFGDAMEKIIEDYLLKCGFEILDKRLICENCEYNIDQYAEKDGKIYFIEQKVRDDHDSSKKRGQDHNFEEKLEQIISRNPDKVIIPIVYFIDPSLTKNKKYYMEELEKIEAKYNIKCYLCYGKELFTLIGIPDVWDDMVINLNMWRETLQPFPNINFDDDAEASFDEIKDLEAGCWRKLLDNVKIKNEIFPVIFPYNTTLKMLLEYYKKLCHEFPKKRLYPIVAEKLENYLQVELNN